MKSIFGTAFGTLKDEPIQILQTQIELAELVDGEEEEEVPVVNEQSVKIKGSTEKDINPFESPKQTQTYIHLQTYPIVASWVKIFHWFPQPHFARDTMMILAYSRYLKTYTLSIDQNIDKKLCELDKRAPFVKTLRMRDIRNVIFDNPIRSIVNNTQQVILDTTYLTRKLVIRPARNALYSARDLRDGFIDFRSQPILRSQFNQ